MAGEELPDLLTVEEAAAMARVVPKTIRNMIQRGDLPGFRFGRQWRVPRAALLAALRGEKAP